MKLKLPLALLASLLGCYLTTPANAENKTISYYNPAYAWDSAKEFNPNDNGEGWKYTGNKKVNGNLNANSSKALTFSQFSGASFTIKTSENNTNALYLNVYLTKPGEKKKTLSLVFDPSFDNHGKTTFSTNDSIRITVDKEFSKYVSIAELKELYGDWSINGITYNIGDTNNNMSGPVDVFDISIMADGYTHKWNFIDKSNDFTVNESTLWGDQYFTRKLTIAGGDNETGGALIYIGYENGAGLNETTSPIRILGGNKAITKDSTFSIGHFQRAFAMLVLKDVTIDKVDNTPATREDALITFEGAKGKSFTITNLKATDSGTHTVEGQKFGNQMGSILYISGADSVVLADSAFTNCTSSAKAPNGDNTYGTQGTVYFNGLSQAVIKNVKFISNHLTSTANSAMGGAICTWGSNIKITNSMFDANTVTDLGYGAADPTFTGYAGGGALYLGTGAWGGAQHTTALIENSSFKNNEAIGWSEAATSGSIAKGGAIYVEHRVRKVDLVGESTSITPTLTNCDFSGNKALSSSFDATSASMGGGGAIYLRGAELTLNVTDKDYVYKGNVASLNGLAKDEMGGFLMLYSHEENGQQFNASASFDIAFGRTLTIGEGKAGYDSIAGNAGSFIVKDNEGKLIVNSSMEFYKGSLNVMAGTFASTSAVLGASSVSVAKGASLIAGITGVDLKTSLATATGVLTAEAGATLGTYLTNAGEIVKVKHSDVMNSIQNAYGINDVAYTYWTQGKFNIDFSTGDSGAIGGLGEGSTVTVTGKGEELADGAINLAGGTADMTNVTGEIKGSTVTGDTGSMLTNDTQTVVFSSDQNVGYGMIGKDADGKTIAGAALVVGTDAQTNETAPAIVLTGDVHSKEITLKGGNLTLSNNTVTTDEGLTVGDNSTPAKATLTNNGTIIGDVDVLEGNTLKGAGTYIGDVTLTKSTFVVGNSPGQNIFATGSSLAASDTNFLFAVDGTTAAVQGGSTSGTYSNIILRGTANATGTGNTATIEVWRGLLDATSTQLNLTLINNEGTGTIGANFFSEAALVTGQYAELLKNAKISLDANGNVVLTGKLDSSYAQSVIAVDAQAYANSLWSSSQVVSDFGKLSRDQASAPRNKQLNLWMSAMGDFSSVTGTQGYTYNGGGYGIGGDYAFNKSWIAGAGFGQTWGTNKTDNAMLSNKQDGTMFSLYGQYAKELSKTKTFLVDAYFGYGQVENKATEALNMVAPSKWSDNVYSAGLRTSWAMEGGNDFIVTPFVALDFVTAQQGAITAGTRSYNDGKMHNLSMPIGINFAKKFSLGGTQYLIPSVSVAYAPDLSRKDPSVHSSVLGEDVKFSGVKPGRNAAVINVGTRWIMSRNWSSAVNYTLEARPKMTNQAVNLSVNYSF